MRNITKIILKFKTTKIAIFISTKYNIKNVAYLYNIKKVIQM